MGRQSTVHQLGSTEGKNDLMRGKNMVVNDRVPANPTNPTTAPKESVSKQTTSEGLQDERKRKPTLFLPTSDKAAEDREWLSKVIEVVHPGHGNPSVLEMIGGFRAISTIFAALNGSSTAWVDITWYVSRRPRS